MRSPAWALVCSTVPAKGASQRGRGQVGLGLGHGQPLLVHIGLGRRQLDRIGPGVQIGARFLGGGQVRLGLGHGLLRRGQVERITRRIAPRPGRPGRRPTCCSAWRTCICALSSVIWACNSAAIRASWASTQRVVGQPQAILIIAVGVALAGQPAVLGGTLGSPLAQRGEVVGAGLVALHLQQSWPGPGSGTVGRWRPARRRLSRSGVVKLSRASWACCQRQLRLGDGQVGLGDLPAQ